MHNSIRLEARFNAMRGGSGGVVLASPDPFGAPAPMPAVAPVGVEEEVGVDSMVVNVLNTSAVVDGIDVEGAASDQ